MQEQLTGVKQLEMKGQQQRQNQFHSFYFQSTDKKLSRRFVNESFMIMSYFCCQSNKIEFQKTWNTLTAKEYR